MTTYLVTSSALLPLQLLSYAVCHLGRHTTAPLTDLLHLITMVEPRLKVLALQLASQSTRIYQDLVLYRTVISQGHIRVHRCGKREWEITGCFYGRDLKRIRPYYEGLDDDKSTQNKTVCQKYYEPYKKNTLPRGLMALCYASL